jgi:flagellar biosynthesis component FlhA
MYSTIFWIFINIIFSTLIIYITHHIWNYLKDTYSTKKTKDLVNTQIDKYKKIIDELQENQSKIPVVSETDFESMNNDLTDFMKNELS